jgi:PAS domain S-box-containing protein
VAALCRGVSAVLACPDLETAADQILLACRELIRAPDVAVALFPEGVGAPSLACLDAAGEACRLPASRAASAAGMRAIARRIGEGRVDNRRPRATGLPLPVRPGGRLDSVLVAPMTLDGTPVGLICLGNKPGGFDGQDLLVVSSFGRLAAAANQRCSDADVVSRSAERFRNIFEQSPIGIEVYDLHGRLEDANRACLDMFGVRDLRQIRGFELFRAPDFSAETWALLQSGGTVHAEAPFDFDRVRREKTFPTSRRGVVQLDALITPLLRGPGNPPSGFLVQIQDVTALRRSTLQLREAKAGLERRVARATERLTASNARLRRQVEAHRAVKRSLEAEHAFREAVESSMLTGIFVTDADERLVHVNRAFCRMVGWRRQELIGKTPPFPFWPPESRAARLKAFRALRKESAPREGVRGRYLRRNGEQFDVLIVNSRLRGPRGACDGLVASVADITAEVRADTAHREAAERLKRLSAELLSVEERERRRISRELHDSLGQTLSGLKYRLEDAIRECGSCTGTHVVRDKLRDTARLLGDAVGEVRAIVMDLRPSVLDDLGLLATFRWFCREYQRTHPRIRVDLRLAAAEDDVPEPLKIVLFRILQEALANVARHSGAGRAAVRVVRRGARLQLAVRDDGRGFDRRATARGVGLASMQERADLSGGTLTVSAGPGRGTVVRAAWEL